MRRLFQMECLGNPLRWLHLGRGLNEERSEVWDLGESQQKIKSALPSKYIQNPDIFFNTSTANSLGQVTINTSLRVTHRLPYWSPFFTLPVPHKLFSTQQPGYILKTLSHIIPFWCWKPWITAHFLQCQIPSSYHGPQGLTWAVLVSCGSVNRDGCPARYRDEHFPPLSS